MKNKKRENARLNKTEKTSSLKGCAMGDKSDNGLFLLQTDFRHIYFLSCRTIEKRVDVLD